VREERGKEKVLAAAVLGGDRTSRSSTTTTPHHTTTTPHHDHHPHAMYYSLHDNPLLANGANSNSRKDKCSRTTERIAFRRSKISQAAGATRRRGVIY
jgi:hypothetical protein